MPKDKPVRSKAQQRLLGAVASGRSSAMPRATAQRLLKEGRGKMRNLPERVPRRRK